MRLFLLPISTRRSLIYCQRLNKQLNSEITFADRIASRASATWLKWEKAEKGWRKKVTAYGNRLLETIPHEEWGLKSIPPLNQRRKGEELEGMEEVQVEFPGTILDEEGARIALRKYASEERKGYHTKWMWGSLIGMPISAPFALIPVIPNLPFLYLCFRAWSHWKARGGAQHMEFLLNNQLFKLTPSSKLDSAYRIGALDVAMAKLDLEVKGQRPLEREPASDLESKSERMLLTQSNGRLIADELEVPQLEEEIQRAVKQVEKELRGKQELSEEKKDLESATEGSSTKQ